MAIAKRPATIDEDRFQKFVEKAPGTVVKEIKAEEPRRKRNGRIKQPITLTIAPELLRKVDIEAQSKGMSRAAYIAMVLSYASDHGIFK